VAALRSVIHENVNQSSYPLPARIAAWWGRPFDRADKKRRTETGRDDGGQMTPAIRYAQFLYDPEFDVYDPALKNFGAPDAPAKEK